jgi:hypothetical protein
MIHGKLSKNSKITQNYGKSNIFPVIFNQGWSSPPSDHGLQRIILQMDLGTPRKIPYFLMASLPYSEQVG